MRIRQVNLLTEFASTGDPNGEQTRELVQWEPVHADEPLKCLNLSHNLTYVEMPELDRMRFWDSLYEKQAKRNGEQQTKTDENGGGGLATIPVSAL